MMIISLAKFLLLCMYIMIGMETEVCHIKYSDSLPDFSSSIREACFYSH